MALKFEGDAAQGVIASVDQNRNHEWRHSHRKVALDVMCLDMYGFKEFSCDASGGVARHPLSLWLGREREERTGGSDD